MQALLNHQGAVVFKDDIKLPILDNNEVLVKITLAGICSTDLEIIKGYTGFSGILGHEFVGVVEHVNDAGDEHWLGKRVVGSINIGCGQCKVCRCQGPEHCINRTVLGIREKQGCFAEYISLPVANLYEVTDTIEDEAAVFTEPLAAACRIQDQLLLTSNLDLAVVGPGKLGLLIAAVLALSGNQVTVLGRSELSLHLPESWGLNTALADQMADDSFDCVVEATGHVSGFNQSLRLLRARGNLVLKSTMAQNSEIDLTKIVVAEINVIGSRCGPFAAALALLQRNDIPVIETITAKYPLSEGQQAIAHATEPGVRKVLLTP